jgi:hypothetical protein
METLSDHITDTKQDKPSGPSPEPFHAIKSGASSTTTIGFQQLIGDERYFLGFNFNNDQIGLEEGIDSGQLEAQLRHTSGIGTIYGRLSYGTLSLDSPDSLTLESAYESPSKIFGLHAQSTSTGLLHETDDPNNTELRLAPIVKTPAFSLPGLTGIRLGFSPQLRYNTATADHSVVIRGKLEWSHNTERWSGSSIEAYASLDEGKLNPLGLYFWTGGYVPNIFGDGNLLLEGGAWLGTGAFDGSEKFGEALMAGLLIRATFSGATSGFEPGRYSGM